MSDEYHKPDESTEVKAATKNEEGCGSRCPGDNGQCRKLCTKPSPLWGLPLFRSRRFLVGGGLLRALYGALGGLVPRLPSPKGAGARGYGQVKASGRSVLGSRQPRASCPGLPSRRLGSGTADRAIKGAYQQRRREVRS
jgi:hypothetical protein